MKARTNLAHYRNTAMFVIHQNSTIWNNFRGQYESELARNLGLSNHLVKRLMSGLENDGFVEKYEKRWTLTDSGQIHVMGVHNELMAKNHLELIHSQLNMRGDK